MPINVVAMSLSPILAAWLYETTHNYNVPYTFFLCTFIAGTLFMLFAKAPTSPVKKNC